ncbi:MAG: gliding motility-associated C-terminal domain-containing protein [Sphingomonadales bacterium]|jgi:gliding motility-associated-like protein
MTNEQNPIDELFRNTLKDGGLTPPPGVWEALSAGLPAAAAPGLITVVVKSVWTWVVAGCIVAGGLTAVLSSEKQQPPADAAQTTETAVAEMPSKAEVTEQAKQTKRVRESMAQQPSSENPSNSANSEQGHSSGKTPKTEHGSAAAVNVGNEHAPQPVAEQKTSVQLIVEDQNTGTIPACGRILKIAAAKAGDNNWSFNMPSVPSGAYCSWNFGDGESGNGNSVQHQYADVNAEYEVKVLVFRSASCMDSGICRVITRQLHKGLSIPDVITPNGDGLNDELVVTLPETVQFSMMVTDRNGKKVFTSNNPAQRWNGKCASEDCPSGSYKVFISYKTTTAKQAVTYTKTLILKR